MLLRQRDLRATQDLAGDLLRAAPRSRLTSLSIARSIKADRLRPAVRAAKSAASTTVGSSMIFRRCLRPLVSNGTRIATLPRLFAPLQSNRPVALIDFECAVIRGGEHLGGIAGDDGVDDGGGGGVL